MFHLTVIVTLLCVAFVETHAWQWTKRIISGEETFIRSHPYQVSIQTKANEHICGGCIINKFIVLTAAHCFDDIEPHETKVRLGSTYYSNGGRLVGVKNFTLHYRYKFSIVPIYDIAILKISKPVYQTKTVRYIKLAKKRPRTGARAVVSGWGTTVFGVNGTSAHLRKATVRYIDSKDCASFGRNIYRVFITETMICAETLDQAACAGDSGSPLVVKGELVGIASWGAGCGAQNFPDVYTDVVALRYWINNALKTLIKRENSEKQNKQMASKYNMNSENRIE
uniref:Peptidase S1 domain-containing protein n=1 Tax=Glossina palpalis gambiensis TaxID=67801 RepID=A0A1B0B285_9MUSC